MEPMKIEEGWETYYWIPTVYTGNDNGPTLCQNTYTVEGITDNISWDWDYWMCDDYDIDAGVCQWIIVTPGADTTVDTTADIYMKFGVSIAGTNVFSNFFQFFKINDGYWECPYDDPDCDMPSSW